MKSIKIFSWMIIASLLLSSCAHTVYSTDSFKSNYFMRMRSNSELEIRSKVLVFESEKDVKGNYEVIYINTYYPFSIPILMGHKSQMKKKFYEKAVKKAYSLGGNGIIIQGPGTYKVINILNWDSDNEEAGTYKSLILDMSRQSKIADKGFAEQSARNQKRTINEIQDEIAWNIKYVTTIDEVEAIRTKLSTLEDYNNHQEKPNRSIAAKIKTSYLKLAAKERKILKKANKEGNTNAKSLVLDMTHQLQIADKSFTELPERNQKRMIQDFQEEINRNIQYLNSVEEVEAIRTKLSTLEEYNNHQEKPSKSIASMIADAYKQVASKERRILKKMQKAQS